MRPPVLGEWTRELSTGPGPLDTYRASSGAAVHLVRIRNEVAVVWCCTGERLDPRVNFGSYEEAISYVESLDYSGQLANLHADRNELRSAVSRAVANA